MNENQRLGIMGIGVAMLVVVIGLFLSTYKINPGYAGVVYNMDGGIESDVLGQGFHMVAPWRKVVEYPVSTETVYYNMLYLMEKEMYRAGQLKPKYRRSTGLSKEEFKAKLAKDLGCRA